MSGSELNLAGIGGFLALFLVVAALYIGYDAWQAYTRIKPAKAAPAPAG